MLTLKVEVQGKTIDDLVMALNVLTDKVEEGYVQGYDRNEDGSYRFDVTKEEEEENE